MAAKAPLRLTLILGALTASAPMSIDMYLPSLPTLERAFATDSASVQLTLAAYFVGLALGQAVYGPLSDRWGRKPPLVVGLAIYIAASVGCALAPSIDSLIVLRLAQALGGCAGTVVARAVVRDLFEQQDAARMFSLMVLVMGAAPILAPLVGGQILALLGWQAIFWALALFGLACLAAVLFGLPETRPATRGGGGFTGVLLTYGLLLRDRRFLGHALAGGVAQAGMFAYITGSPKLFIDVYGIAPEHFGFLFGLNALGLILAAQLNRRLLTRVSSDAILYRASATIAGFGLLLLVMAVSDPIGPVGILVPLFLYVATLGFSQPNAIAGAMAAHAERAGSASALIGTLQFTVGACAGVLVGLLPDDGPLGMAAVIAACGMLALAAQRLMIGPPKPVR
jgi:MFS transporter, DHA1 family, multidrug resistance protein